MPEQSSTTLQYNLIPQYLYFLSLTFFFLLFDFDCIYLIVGTLVPSNCSTTIHRRIRIQRIYIHMLWTLVKRCIYIPTTYSYTLYLYLITKARTLAQMLPYILFNYYFTPTSQTAESNMRMLLIYYSDLWPIINVSIFIYIVQYILPQIMNKVDNACTKFTWHS